MFFPPSDMNSSSFQPLDSLGLSQSHFLPFFFFLPAVLCCVGGCDCACTGTSALSSCTAPASPITTSPLTSGNAAISLPKLPIAAINLPTSAALSVRYFSVVPDTGSKVLSSRRAIGWVGFVESAGSVVVEEETGLGDMEEAEGMWYFVVMRVCERSC
jgi:hypothetical protein